MSRNRIPAVVVYGMFRDSHGGVEAAQALCRYANERGVRILPGVAINAYGGIYREGDHPFNLATWLRKHPELSARMERAIGFQIEDLAFPLSFPRSDYTVSGCPSRRRTSNGRLMVSLGSPRHATSVASTSATAITGLRLRRMRCAASCARGRRPAREFAESWSHADMADFYPRLFRGRAVCAQRDDLWLYSGCNGTTCSDAQAHAPLRALPREGIYQHTLNRLLEPGQRTAESRLRQALPTETNVFRAVRISVERQQSHRLLQIQRP